MYLLQIFQAFYPPVIIGVFDDIDKAILAGSQMILWNPQYKSLRDCNEFLKIVEISYNKCDIKHNKQIAQGNVTHHTVWHSHEELDTIEY